MTAAALVVCSGAIRVASLWFRPLDGEAVLTLLIGAIYLIAGIGLFGQSRFALFAAIIACTTTAWLVSGYFTLLGLQTLQLVLTTVDGVAVLLCALVLWYARRQPGL